MHLPGLADTRQIVEELELGTADAFGATAARIALWDSDKRCLRVDATQLPSTLERAWVEQRASLIRGDLTQTDAAHTASFGVHDARAALLAPITAYQKRIGVLVVFAPRAPVFADSDLELIQLLRDSVLDHGILKSLLFQRLSPVLSQNASLAFDQCGRNIKWIFLNNLSMFY